MAVVVTGLNVFPVKSCRAVSVAEAVIDQYGFSGDRRVMVVDQGGRFLSQRRFPKLATVSAIYSSDGVLTISAPSMDRELTFKPNTTGHTIDCAVWESKVCLIDQGPEPAVWFDELLGAPGLTKVVCCGQSYSRKVDNLPSGLAGKLPPMSLALSDAGPISLISQQSLADLNGRLLAFSGQEVPLNRFRMNIEVTGCSTPFEEDTWLVIKIGDTPFLSYAHAERCKMTGIDQTTGAVDKSGPLEVLRQYRAPQGPSHARFGQLLIPLQTGTIKLGDTITVLDYKKK